MADTINLISSQVKAFPAVNRNSAMSGDIYARHTSEQFMAGIVNQLIDRNGFVITDQADFGLDKEFKFNIHGYYFTLNTASGSIASGLSAIADKFNNIAVGSSVYAYINLAIHGNKWEELAGQDAVKQGGDPEVPSDYEYTSLYISDTKPSNNDNCIVILKRTNDGTGWDSSNWVVPEDSYVKFDGNSFIINMIDGGDMDIIS